MAKLKTKPQFSVVYSRTEMSRKNSTIVEAKTLKKALKKFLKTTKLKDIVIHSIIKGK